MKRCGMIFIIGWFFLSFLLFPTIGSAQIFVPSLNDGFYLGVSGYYLEPSFSNGDIDYASVSISPTVSQIQSSNLGDQGGWGILVGYIFPQSGNDTTLSYFHVNGNHTNSTSTNIEGITPIGFTSTLIGNVDQANSKISLNFNQVDWTFGQYINVCPNLRLHTDGGLRYLNIDRNLSDWYINTPTVNVMSVVEDSYMNAIGFVGGLGSNYYLGHGFSFRSYFDTAMLIGRIDTRLDAIEGPVPLNYLFETTWDITNDKFHIMPGYDLKLGVDYKVPLRRFPGFLTFEAGYQASKYFNVIDRVGGFGDMMSLTVNRHRTANFGLSGPYISVVYGM